jgi:WD40-like Beta Propeller Repeat
MGMPARGLGGRSLCWCGWSARTGRSGAGWLGRVAAGVGASWLGLVVVVASAHAAFPGRDGLLAVQPRAGGGIVLVGANGRGERRICMAEPLCGTPRRPRWSADGRALVFAGPGIRIVYPDGSCLDCQFGAASNPAFEPSGTVVSFIDSGSVAVDGIDGIRERARPSGAAIDAVWSAQGRLAAVRAGAVWAGLPGHLRKRGSATAPSWSPSGTEIAAVQRGWVVIMRVGDGRVRRLVRGNAPTFSPDGRWVAFVAPDHRLMIVRTAGAHPVPRSVGNIQAVSVDWQPRPYGANPGCRVPSGSRVLARSADASVTGDGLPVFHTARGRFSSPPLAYMGCLRANGRERLLERFGSNNINGAEFIASAVVAAPYAALVLDFVDPHYGGQSSTVQVFDLGTGSRQTQLGGESANCRNESGTSSLSGGCPNGGLDHVVLGSDGVSAAHLETVDPVGSGAIPAEGVACAPATTVCVATDFFDLFSSSRPSAVAGAWTRATVAAQPAASPFTVACPSPSLCVAAGPFGIYTSTDPTGGASQWRSITVSGGFLDGINVLSCPSTTLCVGSGLGGVVASTDPTGGAAAWSSAQISNHVLGAVFCSTLPQCFVTGQSISSSTSRTVFTSTRPAAGVGTWQATPGTPPFTSGTCPTTSLCVAIDDATDHVLTTTNPGAGAWTQTSVPDDLDGGVACPSASLCVAVGTSGALEVSTDPASGVWTSVTIDHGSQLNAIACPSVSLCVAVDANGNAVTSTDPTGGPSAWTPARLDGCPGPTACSTEQILASDHTGVHSVDSGAFPVSGPFLTGLSLTGDVLSWRHAGTPQNVTLTP